MVNQTIDIPESLYVNNQVLKIWKSINIVHSMYFDQSVTKQGFLLHGDSGMGKTFLLKKYCAQVSSQFTGETNTIPILYLAINRTTKSVDEIPQLLINALGAPLHLKKPTSICLERQLVHMLQEKRVELIMLDEIQNLNTSYDGLEFQKVIKYLCSLIDRDDIECSIVFAGSDYAKRIMSFGSTGKTLPDGEHLSRRLLRPIRLTAIKPKSGDWVNCVNWFIQKIGLPALDYTKHRDFLDRLYLAYHDRALSSIRDLFIRSNSRQAKTLEELKDCLFDNFEVYAKQELNPFCEEDMPDGQATQITTKILASMKQAVARKLIQSTAIYL
ncbi:MAG: hypothetical protein ACJAS1_005645 [Oleiphilaceae bacterium]|jgi:hypothetical protein